MSFKRSKWKGILLKSNYHDKIKNNTKLPIRIYNRNCIVTPNCLGHKFEIHNGIKFIKLIVVDRMVGHKFGEFSSTRKKNIFKKQN